MFSSVAGYDLIVAMNIVVGETSRYKTLKGYCFMSCKTIYVMISSFLSEEEKMIVAAHELGHIILHRSQLKMAPMQDDTLYNMTVSYTHLYLGQSAQAEITAQIYGGTCLSQIPPHDFYCHPLFRFRHFILI